MTADRQRFERDKISRPCGALLLLSLVCGVGAALPLPSADAAFPGLNGKITFATDRAGGPFLHDIWAMNPDGSNQTRLTTEADGETSPVWSPDGTRIAFDGDRMGSVAGNQTPELYVMNRDGTNRVRLTFNPAFDGNPCWSPDGSRLAFVSTRAGGDADIWTANADGSAQTNVTEDIVRTGDGTDARDLWPAWSADGTKIAFASDRERIMNPDDSDIFVMNPDGTGLYRLTNDVAEDKYPAWSPDDTKIAFTSKRSGNEDIYVMDYAPPGREVNTQARTINSSTDRAPVWSPDGTKIAFASYRDGDSDIYVMNANGSGQTDLTQNANDDIGPDWQRQLPPVARLTATPNAVLTQETVSFNASSSSDPAGFVSRYTWDLNGDGSFETDTGGSPIASGSYASAGVVNVSVMAIDNDGLTSAATVAVSVKNRPPNPFLAISPNPAETRRTVTFDGSASGDPDGSITKYEWDLDGNGSFERNSGSSAKVSRRYSREGTFTVKLRVTDNHGEARAATRTLTVKAPIVAAGSKLYIGPSPNGVKVTRFLLVNVTRKTKVELTCNRKGKRACRRVVRRVRSRTVSFQSLRGKQLKAGTVIEVRITRIGWVGRFLQYKIRQGSYSGPRIRCINPGSKRPNRRC